MASCYGHIRVVEKLLLDQRVDPSDLYNDAICRASEGGRIMVVEKLLLDPRVDPSDSDNYAIRMASSNGHSDVVNRLLMDPRVREKVNHKKRKNFKLVRFCHEN